MSENRQLAIILFADIQGYTAIMQKDELSASRVLRRFHEELETKVKNHEGSIVNFYGDGALCIFQNPVEALRAAMELSASFQLDPLIPVRIGLHSGSIVIEQDKVFGDSINIASRIESLGWPGAILLSKKIRDEIKNQPEFNLKSLGLFDFKNVDEPLELFALANEGFFVPRRARMQGKLKSSHNQYSDFIHQYKWVLLILLAMLILSLMVFKSYRGDQAIQAADPNGIKSIAILPFRNLGEDQSQNYFAEGIVENINNKLSEVKNIRIISMTSTLNFIDHLKSSQEVGRQLKVDNVLEGSVMRDHDRVRIIVKLINALTNEQIWTKAFDNNLNDIFSIQSNIAQSVVNALSAKLTDSELGKLAKVYTGDLQAYDIYLKGLYDQRYNRFDSVLNNSAMARFQEAIHLDPMFDLAYIQLAKCFYHKCKLGCGDPCRDSAVLYAEKALKINASCADALILKGDILVDYGDKSGGKKLYDQAFGIAPNNILALKSLSAYYLSYTDDIEKGLDLYVESLAHNPLHFEAESNSSLLYRNLGSLYERADMFDEAIAYEQKALAVATPVEKKSIYIMLGDMAILSGKNATALAYYDSAQINHSTAFNVLDIWAFGNDLAGNNKVAEATYKVMLDMIRNGFKEDVNTHTFRHRYARLLWIKGQKAEAQKQFDITLNQLKVFNDKGIPHGGMEYDMAGIYNFLGDKEKAFEWLEKMPFDESTYQLSRVDPLMKDLIGNPRYEKIMEKHHEKVAKIQALIKSFEDQGKLMKILKN
jgi:TolB-like protein/class 3 adenylate cyclase